MKAVLVTDMPVICAECNFAEIKGNNLYCTASLKVCYNSKPSWCPLKELPEKKNLEELQKHSLGEDYVWSEGYNSCLDEILKGAD